MPIYEFRCHTCRKRTNVFVRSMTANVRPKCEHCGGKHLSRLISRVTVPRSRADDDSFDEKLLADVDENDPRSMARFARRMRDEMGEDLGPEFEDAIAHMEDGEMPDDSMGSSDDGWDA